MDLNRHRLATSGTEPRPSGSAFPDERGAAVLECALCALLMAPLLLGLAGVGLALVRDIQVNQVARDAGHMFAMGIDFSPTQTVNRNLLLRISRSLGITENSPSKAIILTKVQFVTELDCDKCTNVGRYAISKRVVLGDSANIKSSFGEPQQPDSSGDVPPDVILKNAADCVAPFTPALANLWQTQWTRNKQNGQVAYIAEVVVRSSDLAWTGFAGPYTKATAIF